MFEVKSEFQIIFNAITDMSKYVRSIVSPYSVISPTIKFESIGRPGERAIINIPDSDTIIIIDWMTMAIIRLGVSSNLEKRDGVFSLFYDIYENISSQDYFNGIKSYHLKTWDLLPNKYNSTLLFKNEFLNSKASSIMDIEDINLVLHGKDKAKKIDYSLQFGPFDNEVDVERHKLILFDKNIFKPATSPKEGCLVNFGMNSTKTSFSHDSLKDMMNIKNTIFKNI
ncbi:MAG: hypothetical protein JXR11_11080 [Balneola sp.]